MEPTPVGCMVNGPFSRIMHGCTVNGRVNKAACIRN
jgi:hypothetical protein